MSKLTKEVFEQAFQQVQEAAKTPIDSISCVSPENAIAVALFGKYWFQANEIERKEFYQLFVSDKPKAMQFLIDWNGAGELVEVDRSEEQAKLEHKDE